MAPIESNSKDIMKLLESIPGLAYYNSREESKHLDAITILSLPGPLRKSALAILKVLKGDANMISKITENDEEAERVNLEKLVEMGYLTKLMIESRVFYEIK